MPEGNLSFTQVGGLNLQEQGAVTFLKHFTGGKFQDNMGDGPGNGRPVKGPKKG